MELDHLIEQLRVRQKKVEAAIATLEGLSTQPSSFTPGTTLKRRGRKSMGLQERQEMSIRMKKYWKSQKEGANAHGQS
jgi:hypothetical protein